MIKGYLLAIRIGEIGYFFSPSIFRILPQTETFGRLQNGNIPSATRTASHSSQSVYRLHVFFGQGQSFLIMGGIFDYPETGGGLMVLWKMIHDPGNDPRVHAIL